MASAQPERWIENWRDWTGTSAPEPLTISLEAVVVGLSWNTLNIRAHHIRAWQRAGMLPGPVKVGLRHLYPWWYVLLVGTLVRNAGCKPANVLLHELGAEAVYYSQWRDARAMMESTS